MNGIFFFLSGKAQRSDKTTKIEKRLELEFNILESFSKENLSQIHKKGGCKSSLTSRKLKIANPTAQIHSNT